VNVGIRALEAADIEPLGDALALAYATKEDFHARLRRYVDAPGEQTFVAVCDGEAVGFVAGIDYVTHAIAAYDCASIVGPVIAQDAGSAAQLLAAVSATMPSAHRVSVPDGAAEAVARGRGFRDVRELRHMVRGVPPSGARERVFARINLGQG
jgi:hypothetical protein